MKNHLNPYAGPLTPVQTVEGISVAQKNALRLLEDAKLLLERARFPSAAALAVLAIEERGKAIVLKRLALLNDPADLKMAWREYRNHRAKNAGWIIPELISKGARTMKSMASAVDKDAEHAAVLDALKQVSLYTDCLGEAHWSIPSKVVDEALARSLISAAETMWGSQQVTTREIELWVEFVGPHYDKAGMGDAVVQWQEAMVAEGLSDISPDQLEAFMRGAPI